MQKSLLPRNRKFKIAPKTMEPIAPAIASSNTNGNARILCAVSEYFAAIVQEQLSVVPRKYVLPKIFFRAGVVIFFAMGWE